MTKTVVVYSYTREPRVEDGRAVLLDDGRVELRGFDSRSVEAWTQHGIPFIAGFGKCGVKPSDGAAFLDGLLQEFSGTYVRAEVE